MATVGARPREGRRPRRHACAAYRSKVWEMQRGSHMGAMERAHRCGPSLSWQLVGTGSKPGLGTEAQGRNQG